MRYRLNFHQSTSGVFKMEDEFKNLKFPAVVKYSSGDYVVYTGTRAISTDKCGAIKHVSQLIKNGRRLNYYNETSKVSPTGYFSEKTN